MRECSQEIHYAAFRYGFITPRNARKVTPERPEQSGYSVDGGMSTATVEEWHAGDPPEVLARKVLTSTANAFWLRADIADQVVRRVAEAEEESRRIARDVIEWSAELDEQNAKRRGMTLEEYRRVRNQQGMEIDRRHGRNSYGIR